MDITGHVEHNEITRKKIFLTAYRVVQNTVQSSPI